MLLLDTGRKEKIIVTLVSIIVFYMFLVSCDTTEETSVDRFEVVSNVPLKDGRCYYLLTVGNISTTTAFSVDEFMDNSTVLYEYSQNLFSPTYISIKVTSNNLTDINQTIDVYIYSNDAVVKSGSFTSTYSTTTDDITPPSGIVEYTFNSTTSSDTSSSTTQ